jgi:filamentous hemagglutinin family protein
VPSRHRVSGIALSFALFAAQSGLADVIHDGSFGCSASCAVELTADTYVITPDVVSGKGFVPSGSGNLFFSFGELDVEPGLTAEFQSGGFSVDRIIARVTQGDASDIRGRISSPEGGVSLFLLNPQGFVFGDESTVDVNGSFFVSTADVVEFGDDAELEVRGQIAPNWSALTFAPTSFGFLADDSIGSIVVDGAVTASPDTSADGLWRGDITLVASTISIADGISSGGSADASLKAGYINDYAGCFVSPDCTPQRRVRSSIQLAAVGAGAVDVPVDFSTFDAFATGIGPEATIKFGDGHLLEINTPKIGGGRIVIRAGELTVQKTFSDSNKAGGSAGFDPASESTIESEAERAYDIEVTQTAWLQDGARFTAAQSADDGTGETYVRVGTLVMGGVPTGEEPVGAAAFVSTTNLDAPGGDITIVSDRVKLDSGASIESRSAERAGPQGDAGSVTVTTGGSVTLAGGASIGSKTEKGDRGRISAGDTGLVTVDAESIELSSGGKIYSTTNGPGRNNGIVIRAGSLGVRGLAWISSGDGVGQAGPITIDVEDAIEIEGIGRQNGEPVPNGIFARSTGFLPSTDPGFAIDIHARSLELSDGGVIDTHNFDLPTEGSGNSDSIRIGDVDQPLESLLIRSDLNDPAQIFTDARGDSGEISIHADRIELKNNARISSVAFGSGSAGAITIDSNSLRIAGAIGPNRARIISETNAGINAGTAGSIEIHVTDNVEILDRGQISAKSGGGGVSGDIDIDAGGDVRIESDATVSSNGRFVVNASEPSGLSGNISIHGGSSVSIRQATIETGSNDRDSGQVTITSNGFVKANRLGAQNSQAATRATIETGVNAIGGQGGNITVEAPIVALDDVLFSANAASMDATAGDITIAATRALFQSGRTNLQAVGDIDANAGNILISSPDTNVVTDLAVLRHRLLDVSDDLSESCVARKTKAGTFLVTGDSSRIGSPDMLYERRSEADTNERASRCEIP